MDEDPCPCCRPSADGPPTDAWLEDVTAPLPTALSAALAPFNGGEPVETLAAWAGTVRRATGGVVTVDDLCLVTDPSPHYGIVGGDRHDFACSVDAVILAAIEDRDVQIGTTSPDGTTIDLAVSAAGGVSVTPIDTVFSFGVDHRVEPADPPTLADAYRAICPYVQAFEDIRAYDAWAEEVPAETVAFSSETVTALAARLARPTGSE